MYSSEKGLCSASAMDCDVATVFLICGDISQHERSI
jgi:hypothetical protein